MNEERVRIFKLLEDGKITAAEASALLDAYTAKNATPPPPPVSVYAPAKIAGNAGKAPRFLKMQVKVESANHDNVNVNMNIPLSLARAVKPALTSALPKDVQETLRDKGIDLSALDIDAILDSLSELEDGQIMDVDVSSGGGDNVMVKIYAE